MASAVIPPNPFNAVEPKPPKPSKVSCAPVFKAAVASSLVWIAGVAGAVTFCNFIVLVIVPDL